MGCLKNLSNNRESSKLQFIRSGIYHWVDNFKSLPKNVLFPKRFLSIVRGHNRAHDLYIFQGLNGVPEFSCSGGRPCTCCSYQWEDRFMNQLTLMVFSLAAVTALLFPLFAQAF